MSRAEHFSPLPPERLDRWSRFGKWDTVWFPQFLGLEVEAIRQDYARKHGRQIVSCEAEVRAVSGTLAATGTLVYKVSSKPTPY